jgi:ABC-type dipeptide/oligopeptide/nickel transport system permease component
MTGFRGFIIRRVFHSLITIWVILTVVFVLFRAAPGDPSLRIADATFPPAVRQQILERFGLDKPVWQQYLIYMRNVVQGDLGLSFFTRRPVSQELADRFWNTAILAMASFLIAYPLGAVMGAYLASKRGTKLESLAIAFSLFFRSAPLYWTGMLALTYFSFTLGWFPNGRIRDVGYVASNAFEKYVSLDFLHHLALPAIVAGLYFAALPLLLMRNTVLEVLNEDFIELARAKGLSENAVLFRHGVRNAVLPIVTAAAVYIGLALGGMAVIEVVFSWPGLGREIVAAVKGGDYPVAQGAFLMLAVMISLMNLIADVLYGYLDPRITYQ